jgi:uncharacterized protein YjiS (DUF1127 family)
MSVYATTQNRPVPLGAIGIFTIVSGLDALSRRVRDWRSRRATVAALERLSDEQLRDVGLTRGAVADLARAA